jgi:hypothetical protein
VNDANVGGKSAGRNGILVEAGRITGGVDLIATATTEVTVTIADNHSSDGEAAASPSS